jgi:hypothetical protein
MSKGGLLDHVLAAAVVGAVIGLVVTMVGAFFGMPVTITGPATGVLIVLVLRALRIWRSGKP